jgi:ankyrin repeat protein
LCVAAKRGHSNVIQILCEAGANKDWPDLWGASPLLDACRTGHFEAARLLCKARANESWRGFNGFNSCPKHL